MPFGLYFMKKKIFFSLLKLVLAKTWYFSSFYFLLCLLGLLLFSYLSIFFRPSKTPRLIKLPKKKLLYWLERINKKMCNNFIASQNYTHVFNSPKIALSKKFKTNILYNPHFSNYFLFLAIDKINLVNKWCKTF